MIDAPDVKPGASLAAKLIAMKFTTEFTATLIGEIVRCDITRSNRISNHRRSPETRHPDASRSVISIHPSEAGTRAHRPRYHYPRRNSESNAYRNAGSSKSGTRHEHQCQNCFSHLISSLPLTPDLYARLVPLRKCLIRSHQRWKAVLARWCACKHPGDLQPNVRTQLRRQAKTYVSACRNVNV
jgi:hypothetical protein